jgi:hypothetical protein
MVPKRDERLRGVKPGERRYFIRPQPPQTINIRP